MYNIVLVNMPFGALYLPSIALTQLKAVTDTALGDRACTRLEYLNHDFGEYMGAELYMEISSLHNSNAGLGDWFFRQIAFPELPDNTGAYFDRYYSQGTPQIEALKAAVLEKRAGLDAFFDQLIDEYALVDADLVGLTSMFAQSAACMALARKLKERRPDVVVVVGGANCEAPMGREIVRHVPSYDFVFSGPALKSFPELVRRLIDGDRAGCHRINGVFSQANRVLAEGAAPHGGGLAALGSLEGVRAFGDELPIDTPVALNYDGFLDSVDRRFPDRTWVPMLLFETSRGCWWGERAHCTFCGLNGSTMSYRAMRPELAAEVLQSLFRYSGRTRHLQCVDNIMPKSYLKELWPHVKAPENQVIFYEIKADLTDEDFAVLANAGVTEVQPGIEALNTATLKRMRKGISAFQALQCLLRAARHGVRPHWNLLIGFPGEEREVYDKYLDDLPLFTHLPPPQDVFTVRFDRFSPYFMEAESYELRLRPMDFYRMTYPFPDEALANFAYYFDDDNVTAPYFMNAARMQGKLREKVGRWRQAWEDGGGARPQLYRHERAGRATVFDSRGPEPVEHDIGERGFHLLELLGSAKKLGALTAEVAGLPDFDVPAELNALIDRGLVFHEGERYMSLVFSSSPPERTW
jgi:magnesium-protoporphyrin IX monomethyl ester (oxidative) cyclase